MLKYRRPTSLALDSSSAARCSLTGRRLIIDLTPSSFNCCRCSSLGWPPVQNSLSTRTKFLIGGISCCAANGIAERRVRERINVLTISLCCYCRELTTDVAPWRTDSNLLRPYRARILFHVIRGWRSSRYIGARLPRLLSVTATP